MPKELQVVDDLLHRKTRPDPAEPRNRREANRPQPWTADVLSLWERENDYLTPPIGQGLDHTTESDGRSSLLIEWVRREDQYSLRFGCAGFGLGHAASLGVRVSIQHGRLVLTSPRARNTPMGKSAPYSQNRCI